MATFTLEAQYETNRPFHDVYGSTCVSYERALEIARKMTSGATWKIRRDRDGLVVTEKVVTRTYHVTVKHADEPTTDRDFYVYGIREWMKPYRSVLEMRDFQHIEFLIGLTKTRIELAE